MGDRKFEIPDLISVLTSKIPISLLESAAVRNEEEATLFDVVAKDSNITSAKEIISNEFIVLWKVFRVLSMNL